MWNLEMLHVHFKEEPPISSIRTNTYESRNRNIVKRSTPIQTNRKKADICSEMNIHPVKYQECNPSPLFQRFRGNEIKSKGTTKGERGTVISRSRTRWYRTHINIKLKTNT